MMSSNLAHFDYVQARAVELHREAAQSRLAKRVGRTARRSGSRRSTAV